MEIIHLSVWRRTEFQDNQWSAIPCPWIRKGPGPRYESEKSTRLWKERLPLTAAEVLENQDTSKWSEYYERPVGGDVRPSISSEAKNNTSNRTRTMRFRMFGNEKAYWRQFQDTFRKTEQTVQHPQTPITVGGVGTWGQRLTVHGEIDGTSCSLLTDSGKLRSIVWPEISSMDSGNT